MPLVCSAVLCFAVGLLAGFGGHFYLASAVVAFCGLLALRRRSLVPLAAAMLVISGTLLAIQNTRSAATCARHFQGDGVWRAILEQEATPGTFVRARLLAERCSIPAGLSVREGAGKAGAAVTVAGSAVHGEHSVAIQRAILSAAGGGSLLLRIRGSAALQIDRLFGERSGMVRALLIADSRQLDREMRDQFADAGIVHMLSISGLHVGIIAAAAQLLLRALRLSVATATAGAAIVTAAYVLVIGAPPPAVRAGAMLGVIALSRMLQRPTSPWAALALGALIPLVRPDDVLALGYQLSITGMAGIICAGKVTDRIFEGNSRSWQAVVVGSVLTTILASLATAPIIAWHFGRVSLIAPLTNPPAGPIMLLLQPMLFLALLLAPIPLLGNFVADASRPLLAALELVARVGAAPAWSAVDVAPTLVTVLLTAAAITCVLMSAISRRAGPYLVGSAAAIATLVWLPVLPIPNAGAQLEIHVVDVGQGDAIAIRLPDRNWILFDAGRSWQGGDAGRRQVVPYIRRRGGKLTGFVLSHPHSDHVGGAASIMRWLRPTYFWDAAYVAANDDYLRALQISDELNVAWRRVTPGERFQSQGATVDFLAPDSAWTVSLRDPNDASTVAAVSFGDVKIMLTGDAELAQEEWLVNKYGNRLRSQILKVGHHGSRTSTSQKFLDAVRPKVALVSVGASNRYGHPAQVVLDRLAELGTLVLRTDELGHIVIATDGRRIWVEALGDRWPLS